MSGQTTAKTQQPSKTKKRISLTVILSIFVIPFLGSKLLLDYPEYWPFAPTNHGTLLEAPLPVGDLPLQNIEQVTTHLTDFQGKWLLVFLSENRCDKNCLDEVYWLNQIRKALGKNSEKMLPVVITAQHQQNELDQLVLNEYPQVIQLSINKQDFLQLTAKMPEEISPTEQGGLYIIDPHSYLIMGFDLDNDPKIVLKDLKKLVRS